MKVVERKKKKNVENGVPEETMVDVNEVDGKKKKKKKKVTNEPDVIDGGLNVEGNENGNGHSSKKRKREDGDDIKENKKRKKNITEENNPVEPIVSNDPPVENLAVNLMDLKWRRKIKKELKKAPNQELNISDLKSTVISGIMKELDVQLTTAFEEKLRSLNCTIEGETVRLGETN